MRHDYPEFQTRGAEILAIAPHTPEEVRAFFRRHPFPFPLLVDERHAVFDVYDVPSRLLSLGQRPGLFVVDKVGVIRYAHVGTQQWQIPPNREVLAVLDTLNAEARSG